VLQLLRPARATLAGLLFQRLAPPGRLFEKPSGWSFSFHWKKANRSVLTVVMIGLFPWKLPAGNGMLEGGRNSLLESAQEATI
jgi:hypothetical protein